MIVVYILTIFLFSSFSMLIARDEDYSKDGPVEVLKPLPFVGSFAVNPAVGSHLPGPVEFSDTPVTNLRRSVSEGMTAVVVGIESDSLGRVSSLVSGSAGSQPLVSSQQDDISTPIDDFVERISPSKGKIPSMDTEEPLIRVLYTEIASKADCGVPLAQALKVFVDKEHCIAILAVAMLCKAKRNGFAEMAEVITPKIGEAYRKFKVYAQSAPETYLHWYVLLSEQGLTYD